MRESRSRALLFKPSVRLQRLVICVNQTVRPPQWRVIENKKMRPLIWHVHRLDFQWRRLWIGSQNVSKGSYISVWRKKLQLLWIRLARSRNIRWPQVSVFARRPPVPIFMHFIRWKVSNCRASRERRVPLSWYFEWMSPPSKFSRGVNICTATQHADLSRLCFLLFSGGCDINLNLNVISTFLPSWLSQGMFC